MSAVIFSASSFITGSAPGKPRHTGQVCVFGAAPYSTGQPQNILLRVLSCTWTSRPMVGMYEIADCKLQISDLKMPTYAKLQRSRLIRSLPKAGPQLVFLEAILIR